MDKKGLKIGFIGQGWLGKNYADDFEERGYGAIRYSLEEPYRGNKDKIAACDIVFVAVPTPTVPAGLPAEGLAQAGASREGGQPAVRFDGSVVPKVLPLVGVGKIAVVRSTLMPGMTKELQRQFPDRFVLHAPEFLAEKTAYEDSRRPKRNIIGIPEDTPVFREKANLVLSTLPKAPYELVTGATETELVKYAGNGFLMWKVLFANVMYDLAQALGADYEAIREPLGADPRIGPSHLRVLDASGHPGSVEGRGAGGHCFIKDFGALTALYREVVKDPEGLALLSALEKKNIQLLTASGKDLDLLEGVYGTSA